MIDYLALAMEQERDEEEENIGNDILYVPQTTQVKSGLPRIKNPPLPAPNRERDSTGLPPRLKMPRGGEDFRFSVSRDATRAVPYGAEEETGEGEPHDAPSDAEEATGEGGPAAHPEWLHTAGVSRQGQSPTRRGKNSLLPASSQYIAVGSFSTKAWPRGGVIFDSGGSIASVGAYAAGGASAAAGGFISALEQKELSAREEAVLPLLRQVRQAQRSSGFVQGQRRAFAVTVPEGESTAGAWSAEDFDLACERDARRYGGGFGLY